MKRVLTDIFCLYLRTSVWSVSHLRLAEQLPEIWGNCSAAPAGSPDPAGRCGRNVSNWPGTAKNPCLVLSLAWIWRSRPSRVS